MRFLCLGLAASLLLGGCKERASSKVAEATAAGTGDVANVAAAEFQDLAFDVDDLSLLFPRVGSLPYPSLPLDAASLAAAGVRELWPKATAFDRMIAFAAGRDFAGDQLAIAQASLNPAALPARHVDEESRDGILPAAAAAGRAGVPLADAPPPFNPAHRRIGTFRRDGQERDDAQAVIPFDGDDVHPFVADLARWRVVALRVDPCAHADQDRCEVELRLIAQPFDDRDLDIDTSAHLLFHLGVLDLARGEFVAGSTPPGLSRTFRDLVQDMQRIKALTVAGGSATSGLPLGVHPGLAKEAAGAASGPVGAAVVRLIDTYSAGGLSTVTSMQIVASNPWVFFQGQVLAGTWHPVPITGANDQFSIRKAPTIGSSGGRVTPDPLTHPATAERFNHGSVDPARDYRLENPGRYGERGDKVSVGNTDCLSCHSTGAFGALAPLDSAERHLDVLYVPDAGITGYRAGGVTNSSALIWDFRSFGYLTNKPSLIGRTVNEAAEAARLMNQRLLRVLYGKPFANPGLVCKTADHKAQPAAHAALFDCLRLPSQTFELCKASVCNAPP